MKNAECDQQLSVIRGSNISGKSVAELVNEKGEELTINNKGKPQWTAGHGTQLREKQLVAVSMYIEPSSGLCLNNKLKLGKCDEQDDDQAFLTALETLPSDAQGKEEKDNAQDAAVEAKESPEDKEDEKKEEPVEKKDSSKDENKTKPEKAKDKSSEKQVDEVIGEAINIAERIKEEDIDENGEELGAQEDSKKLNEDKSDDRSGKKEDSSKKTDEDNTDKEKMSILSINTGETKEEDKDFNTKDEAESKTEKTEGNNGIKESKNHEKINKNKINDTKERKGGSKVKDLIELWESKSSKN